jgi:RNA polymerase sigma factor (TIGR02999 family)
MVDDDASAQRRAQQPADDATPDALFVSLYAELRRLADRELNRRPDLPVSAVTLVNEAYLKFAGRPDLTFAGRGQFLAYAAQAMRGLIVDAARERRALKRGGSFHITRLSTEAAGSIPAEQGLERLSDAIDRLRELEPRLAEVVELKYFCGFSFAEIAAARGTVERTVQRDWEKARLLLYGDLGEAGQD